MTYDATFGQQVAPFREPGMGWGLRVAEDVSKGSLVGEYVGEVSTAGLDWFLREACTNRTDHDLVHYVYLSL